MAPSARRAARAVDFVSDIVFGADAQPVPGGALAKIARNREKLLPYFRNLKDSVGILGRDPAPVITRRLERLTSARGKMAAAHGADVGTQVSRPAQTIGPTAR